MSRDNSGTFTRTNGYNSGADTWATDASQDIKIIDSRHDSHDQDIADQLTLTIAADGQTPIVANLPMNGFKHSGCGNPTARNHYMSVSAEQDNSVRWGGLTGGSSTAFTISLTPAIAFYSNGLSVKFVANRTYAALGGTATLNINSVGAKAMVFNNNNDTAVNTSNPNVLIPPYSLYQDVIYTATYISSIDRFLVAQVGLAEFDKTYIGAGASGSPTSLQPGLNIITNTVAGTYVKLPFVGAGSSCPFVQVVNTTASTITINQNGKPFYDLSSSKTLLSGYMNFYFYAGLANGLWFKRF